MSVTVVTPAASARLTTVAGVQLRLPTAGSALVDTLIDAASAAIAQYTHRTWGLQTVTETLMGTGTRYLGLSQTPLGTVGTVTEDDLAITDWQVDDAAAGRLYRTDTVWGRWAGSGWDSLAYTSGYIHPDRAAYRYVATYTAGYVLPDDGGTVTLPADVQQAAVETVKAWYESTNRDPSITRKTVGDVTVTYGAGALGEAAALPPLAVALLRPWQRPAFLPGQ